jgi:membrane protein required for colicin V production
MNGVDVVILLFSGGFLVWGLVKGLARLVLTIIGLFVGFVVATRTYETVGGWLMSLLPNRTAAMVIGFILVLLVVLLIFSLLAGLLRKTLEKAGLSFLDHILGGVLGLIAGMLISSLVVVTISYASGGKEGAVKNSRLAPYVIEFSHVAVKLIPDDLREEFFRRFYDRKRHEEEEDSSVRFRGERLLEQEC